MCIFFSVLFFFNDTATTEIYTLSLHDALPILNGITDAPRRVVGRFGVKTLAVAAIALVGSTTILIARGGLRSNPAGDRKSTRLNSSHQIISYAVFCLKKKKKNTSKLIREIRTS